MRRTAQTVARIEQVDGGKWVVTFGSGRVLTTRGTKAKCEAYCERNKVKLSAF